MRKKDKKKKIPYRVNLLVDGEVVVLSVLCQRTEKCRIYAHTFWTKQRNREHLWSGCLMEVDDSHGEYDDAPTITIPSNVEAASRVGGVPRFCQLGVVISNDGFRNEVGPARNSMI